MLGLIAVSVSFVQIDLIYFLVCVCVLPSFFSFFQFFILLFFVYHFYVYFYVVLCVCCVYNIIINKINNIHPATVIIDRNAFGWTTEKRWKVWTPIAKFWIKCVCFPMLATFAHDVR